MSTTTLSNALIIIGIIWIIGGYFSYMQTVKTNKVVTLLGEKAPRLYRGKNAKFPFTKRLAFAATSDSGKVVDANLISASFIFKPAKILPFPEIIGKNLGSLNPSDLSLDAATEKALESVLEDYQKRKHLTK